MSIGRSSHSAPCSKACAHADVGSRGGCDKAQEPVGEGEGGSCCFEGQLRLPAHAPLHLPCPLQGVPSQSVIVQVQLREPAVVYPNVHAAL